MRFCNILNVKDGYLFTTVAALLQVTDINIQWTDVYQSFIHITRLRHIRLNYLNIFNILKCTYQ